MVGPTHLEPITPDPPRSRHRSVAPQAWLHLTFLHWPVPAAEIRSAIPAELEPDLHDGQAWIGLVPFLLRVPGLGTFPETNLRTYVVDRAGRRGVWFYSLDASRLAAVLGARALYGTPYFWSAMDVDVATERVHYRSTRRRGTAATDIVVRPGEVIAEATDLEHFLTARWRLFATRRGRIVRAEVTHPRWALRRATVERLEQNLVAVSGVPPLVHFSDGTRAEISRPLR